MSSIFSKIINGEIPCYKVAENESCFAFLDISPLAKGHVLVVPKQEVDNIFDLEPSLYSELFSFAQQVAKAIEKTIPCKKVGITVIGLEVPHAHIHLIPINEVSDINFSRPKSSFPADEMKSIAEKIAEAIK